MSDITKAERAKKVYDTLCASIENRGWHFNKEEGLLLVHFGVRGDDIPMRFVLVVDEDRQLVRLTSRLPFNMAEDKRIEGAIATCAATNKLANGCFDYDITEGSITFRMTASYRESEIGEGLFLYMIDCSASTVDDFNDKFFAISKGLIDISDFLGSL